MLKQRTLHKNIITLKFKSLSKKCTLTDDNTRIKYISFTEKAKYRFTADCL